MAIAATLRRNIKTGIKMKYIIALITIFAGLTGCSEEPPEEFNRIVLSTF